MQHTPPLPRPAPRRNDPVPPAPSLPPPHAASQGDRIWNGTISSRLEGGFVSALGARTASDGSLTDFAAARCTSVSRRVLQRRVLARHVCVV